MNVQVLTDPFGRLLRASPVLPGSTHDMTAAHTHGIVDALTDAVLKRWAVKAPGRRRLHPVTPSAASPKRWQRRHNTTHAKIRCLAEQAMTPLKGWGHLRILRCSTNRITAIDQAVLVLHYASA
nr:transposase family protein [Streptomyces sp.]